jgi:predicted TIM-barrel fold metal-dependent hydrolase
MKVILCLLAMIAVAIYCRGEDFAVPGTNASLVVEQKAAHPFLAEFERHLVLKRDGVKVASERLYTDSGSGSLANLYLLNSGGYRLIDMNGFWFDVDIDHSSIRENEWHWEEQVAGNYLGCFAPDAKTKQIGFVGADKRKEASAYLIKDPERPKAEQSDPSPSSYPRIKASLDKVPAIDTHDHLWRWDELPGWREAEDGTRVINLASIWQNSYLSWFNAVPGWKPREKFMDWWRRAKPGFADVRAMSVYRYTLPALQDLYGVDFEEATDEQIAALNQRITANYRDQRWLYEVITERANIEVMLNDPYWEPFDFESHYGFVGNVLRLNPLFRGFHPSEFAVTKGGRKESPYDFAKAKGIQIESFDDYLAFVERVFVLAKEAGLAGLKHTLAYQRTLDFAKATKEQAAEAFGKERKDLKPEQVKAFEDFMMWHLCELSAKHALPFQIHTGHARIQGSNPMLLVDLIAANPKTTFVLFHGGFPWVGESGAIAARMPNVYIDSVWLPTLSQTMAKQAFHEWLDVMPSTRILWGADYNHAEGIYGATEFTRRVLAEVLAERVDRGELRMVDAEHIGRQILRENALRVFPRLQSKLWRHRQAKMTPP